MQDNVTIGPYNHLSCYTGGPHSIIVGRRRDLLYTVFQLVPSHCIKGVQMSDASTNTRTEFLKAVSDHFKHITTLSSGFILVMVAFLEKFFAKPEWKSLVIVAFVSFALATLFSVIAQVFFIDLMRRSQVSATEGTEGITTGVTLAAWGSFLVGTLSLIALSVKNFL